MALKQFKREKKENIDSYLISYRRINMKNKEKLRNYNKRNTTKCTMNSWIGCWIRKTTLGIKGVKFKQHL